MLTATSPHVQKRGNKKITKAAALAVIQAKGDGNAPTPSSVLATLSKDALTLPGKDDGKRTTHMLPQTKEVTTASIAPFHTFLLGRFTNCTHAHARLHTQPC